MQVRAARLANWLPGDAVLMLTASRSCSRPAGQPCEQVSRFTLATWENMRIHGHGDHHGGGVARQVDDETSYLLHSDAEWNVPVTSPAQAAQADRAEVDRLVAEGYSYETAVQACTPLTRDIRVEGAIQRVR